MPDDTSPQLEVFASLDTLYLGAAERIAHAARAAVYNRKKFRFVLSGGEELRPLYKYLAAEYREHIPWQQVTVFFTDERCVPGPSSDSNYAMAAGALLSHVPIAKRNEHRVAGELDAADESRSYERTLRAEAPNGDDPVFDVLLLNVGEDGSIASLFPGSAALEERDRWVLPVRAPSTEMIPQRITLTLPILNRAREVILLAAGADRGMVARSVLNGDPAALDLPAARVRGVERTTWLTTLTTSQWRVGGV
jgi:6-phosphogluconolactonase